MDRRRFPIGLNGEAPSGWLGLVAVTAAVAASTLLVYPLKTIAPAVSLGVVYIPGVLLISTVWGLRLGLLTALLSAVAFNWFHLPPVGELDVAADHDLVALAVFAIAAVASGTLADLARARAVESERRRQEADRALTELAALAARARPHAGGGDRGRGAAPQRRAEDGAAARGLPRSAHAADLDHRRGGGAGLAERDPEPSATS